METHPASSVLSNVIRVVSSETQVDVSEIKPSTTLRSLVTDSLELTNLIVELEGAFGLTIEDDDLQKISSVQDVAKYIEAHAK